MNNYRNMAMHLQSAGRPMDMRRPMGLTGFNQGPWVQANPFKTQMLNQPRPAGPWQPMGFEKAQKLGFLPKDLL
jgi:hypothetical protein